MRCFVRPGIHGRRGLNAAAAEKGEEAGKKERERERERCDTWWESGGCRGGGRKDRGFLPSFLRSDTTTHKKWRGGGGIQIFSHSRFPPHLSARGENGTEEEKEEEAEAGEKIYGNPCPELTPLGITKMIPPSLILTGAWDPVFGRRKKSS